jgi:hypothetical protein
MYKLENSLQGKKLLTNRSLWLFYLTLRILDFGFWILDFLGYKPHPAEFWILDFKFWI